VLYGVSDGMLLLAGLGVDPWDVFHQGLSRHFGLGVGTWALIVGAFVMLLWIPLHQRPGFGTISNVLVIGPVIDLMLVVFAPAHGLAFQIALMAGGVVLNGLATGAYIGAGLGPGPRDGLMTGLAKRGLSIRVARTMIEVVVVIVGFLLGGTFGVGTILFALSIGPLAQVFIPLFEVRRPPAAIPEPAPSAA
jgi:uncharacterized membrane protein YczE